MQGVSVELFAERMKLNCFTPCIDYSKRYIQGSDVNRPGLELAGFFEHFNPNRVQVIGNVEHAYLMHMPDDIRSMRYKQLLDKDVPCVVVCRGYRPNDDVLEIARECGVPIFGTDGATSEFLSETIYYLKTKLAPSISIHGVLVDVYGEGILITGESGIGKSEAALELIRRGHRLVTDDVVEIQKINNYTLMGTSPEITRHFIELRGIGIIDVRSMFGVESVKEKQSIDLVVKLEEWSPGKEYDRLGLEEQYTEILGNFIPSHSIPIRPGRNLAIIVEAAAINNRQKKMGYNAAQELYQRVQNNLVGGME